MATVVFALVFYRFVLGFPAPLSPLDDYSAENEYARKAQEEERFRREREILRTQNQQRYVE